eukprot:TRINITY_DN575_c6_g1_i1.p1 TRINITY_DN575_c6_g1~~TRINITY_DN575_c6_g1_i1.p1  ORF type:complete len:1151 (+),score=143.02 TRINITY_DN575_c6_g1_i1:86-3454(+)
MQQPHQQPWGHQTAASSPPQHHWQHPHTAAWGAAAPLSQFPGEMQYAHPPPPQSVGVLDGGLESNWPLLGFDNIVGQQAGYAAPAPDAGGWAAEPPGPAGYQHSHPAFEPQQWQQPPHAAPAPPGYHPTDSAQYDYAAPAAQCGYPQAHHAPAPSYPAPPPHHAPAPSPGAAQGGFHAAPAYAAPEPAPQDPAAFRSHAASDPRVLGRAHSDAAHGYAPAATSHEQAATSYEQAATSHEQSTTGYEQAVVSYQPAAPSEEPAAPSHEHAAVQRGTEFSEGVLADADPSTAAAAAANHSGGPSANDAFLRHSDDGAPAVAAIHVNPLDDCDDDPDGDRPVAAGAAVPVEESAYSQGVQRLLARARAAEFKEADGGRPLTAEEVRRSCTRVGPDLVQWRGHKDDTMVGTVCIAPCALPALAAPTRGTRISRTYATLPLSNYLEALQTTMDLFPTDGQFVHEEWLGVRARRMKVNWSRDFAPTFGPMLHFSRLFSGIFDWCPVKDCNDPITRTPPGATGFAIRLWPGTIQPPAFTVFRPVPDIIRYVPRNGGLQAAIDTYLETCAIKGPPSEARPRAPPSPRALDAQQRRSPPPPPPPAPHAPPVRRARARSRSPPARRPTPRPAGTEHSESTSEAPLQIPVSAVRSVASESDPTGSAVDDMLSLVGTAASAPADAPRPARDSPERPPPNSPRDGPPRTQTPPAGGSRPASPSGSSPPSTQPEPAGRGRGRPPPQRPPCKVPYFRPQEALPPAQELAPPAPAPTPPLALHSAPTPAASAAAAPAPAPAAELAAPTPVPAAAPASESPTAPASTATAAVDEPAVPAARPPSPAAAAVADPAQSLTAAELNELPPPIFVYSLPQGPQSQGAPPPKRLRLKERPTPPPGPRHAPAAAPPAAAAADADPPGPRPCAAAPPAAAAADPDPPVKAVRVAIPMKRPRSPLGQGGGGGAPAIIPVKARRIPPPPPGPPPPAVAEAENARDEQETPYARTGPLPPPPPQQLRRKVSIPPPPGPAPQPASDADWAAAELTPPQGADGGESEPSRGRGRGEVEPYPAPQSRGRGEAPQLGRGRGERERSPAYRGRGRGALIDPAAARGRGQARGRGLAGAAEALHTAWNSDDPDGV